MYYSDIIYMFFIRLVLRENYRVIKAILVEGLRNRGVHFLPSSTSLLRPQKIKSDFLNSDSTLVREFYLYLNAEEKCKFNLSSELRFTNLNQPLYSL